MGQLQKRDIRKNRGECKKTGTSLRSAFGAMPNLLATLVSYTNPMQNYQNYLIYLIYLNYQSYKNYRISPLQG